MSVQYLSLEAGEPACEKGVLYVTGILYSKTVVVAVVTLAVNGLSSILNSTSKVCDLL